MAVTRGAGCRCPDPPRSPAPQPSTPALARPLPAAQTDRLRELGKSLTREGPGWVPGAPGRCAAGLTQPDGAERVAHAHCGETPRTPRSWLLLQAGQECGCMPPCISARERTKIITQSSHEVRRPPGNNQQNQCNHSWHQRQRRAAEQNFRP